MPSQGHAHMITEEDRRVIGKELAGRGAVRTWQQLAPGQGKPGAHPKAKFLNKAESQPPPGEKTHSKPAGIVTVQEEGAVMKEFSAIRGGDAHDHFKSASLFWEIRLKESRVRAAEHEKRSTQSSVFMIVEACDMLHQLAGRDAANVDPGVLEQVKEQIFTGLFADYATKGKQQFRTKLDMLKACVPYYVIAERLFAENEALKLRVQEFEKANADAPKAKSFSSAATQTSTDELNKTSGVDALRESIDQLQTIITELQAEKFRIQLTADEKVSTATAENQNLKDQLDRIKSQTESVMAEAEILRKDVYDIKERNSQLETRNDALWQRSTGLDSDLATLRREYNEVSAQLNYTLQTERRRFKEERHWWLDSFVTERYEWLNSLESVQLQLDKEAKDAAAKAKKKKKKKQEIEEEEADRAQLWQALSTTDALTRDKLEHLYWDEVRLSSLPPSLRLGSLFLRAPGCSTACATTHARLQRIRRLSCFLK
eukprot:Tamp_12237.p1 GENE.Tamp_12237~~Tamp_12237.p1  ORF type:complete len:507 (+),score=135.59 Tamp_12237:64-1521(+)